MTGVQDVRPVVLAVAAVALAGTATSCGPASGPVYGDPKALPSVHLTHTASGEPVCVHPVNLEDRPTSHQATVDANPSGIRSAWVPGVNDRACRVVVRDGSAELARRLAADIRSLKPVAGKPGQQSNCPLDDGHSVRLYFAYPNKRWQVIDATLSGCVRVSAPGRTDVGFSTLFLADLRQLAPPGARA
jgi:hypothetical protein